MNVLIVHIVEQLRNVRNGNPWMGDSLQKKLEQADHSQIFTRPLPDLHSVAEIISHLTFWRNEALIKIKIGAGTKTDDYEENWLPNMVLEEKGWKTILNEYDQSLLILIELLESKNDSFLSETYYDPDFKGTYPYQFLIDGMLHHDIYHLGQLGIIIKYLNL